MKMFKIFLIIFSLFISTPLGADELHMYAGAGLRGPTEEIARDFEKKTGHKINIEYGGMGQLMTRFEMTGTGDLFFSGSEVYIEQLGKKITASYPLVKHIPVMALLKSKAEGISSFEQLARSPLKLGLGDSKAIALGKSGEKLLELSGYGPELQKKVVVRATTIKQLLLYLLNGDVDAAVISRSDAMQNADKLSVLASPEGTPEEISVIGVLVSSAHPETAKELAIFFTTPDAKKIFNKHYFLTVE